MSAAEMTVGFIGAGQMASALAKGFIGAKLVEPAQVIAYDVYPEAAYKLHQETGSQIASSTADVLAKSRFIWLAVKPQQMKTVLDELAPHLTTDHLVVSIASGVSLKALWQGLGHDRRIVRVMPNTPCLMGAGASAYSLGDRATPADGERVGKFLSATGIALPVPEKLLDAVTGLSGSGPAYVYQFIEALSDGGVRMGLPRDIATKLAAQTVLGGAKMVLESGLHPGALKDAVTSPGGTTIAGLHELERGALRGTVMNAVEAATRRSEELGKHA